MNTLLVLTPDIADYQRLFTAHYADAFPNLRIHYADSLSTALPFIRDCELILASPDLLAPLLAQADKLQWVQSTFAGVDKLCASGLRTDYQLTNIRRVFGPLMSEYVFGQILAAERHLISTYQQQQAHEWRERPYRSLAGLTLGIAGLGSIGQHLASTGRHFGMRVLGLKRQPVDVEHLAHLERVYTLADLPVFLRELDYLVLALPATPATRHLINADSLQHLKTDACLINVGRGHCIDESALLTALQTGKLHSAVLDVFAQEPLPVDSPLWAQPNLTITPHQAAVSFPEQVARIFVDNYTRFLQQQPLQYRVDFAQGY